MLAQKLSIQGLVTTPLGGNYCLTGNTTEYHNLGLLPAFTNIRVAFHSNFDPVASAMCYRIGQDHVNADPNRKSDARWYDDDGGGGSLEPLLNFQTPHACSVYIFVGQFSGSSHGTTAKCYDYGGHDYTASGNNHCPVKVRQVIGGGSLHRVLARSNRREMLAPYAGGARPSSG